MSLKHPTAAILVIVVAALVVLGVYLASIA
jgi:hypothetical protein